ncbi:hypothetical protein HN51_019222 [Arachis hypogaea]
MHESSNSNLVMNGDAMVEGMVGSNVGVEEPFVLFSSQQGQDICDYILDTHLEGNVSAERIEGDDGRRVAPNIVAADTEEDERVTVPIVKARRLFHTPRTASTGNVKRPRVSARATAANNPRKPLKPKFKATFDMDFNRADTLLFNYLFSDGHPLDETLVRIREYGLTRRDIYSLIPGHPIHGSVVEMVAMRNACSIQHVKNTTFWCLPPSFAEDVTLGLSGEELAEKYVPFWIKPSKFVSRIFIPIEDIFMHWYCMVVDFSDKCVYHLDSYPDPNMVHDREKVMRTLLVNLHEVTKSKCFGPCGIYIPSNFGTWPVRDSSGAWVISWMDLEGRFNPLEISGVLEDSTIRGRKAISLAGCTFNVMGSLLRVRAARWFRGEGV